MTFHSDRFFRALLLACLAAMIFYLDATGALLQFLHSEYIVLTQIASIILLFLFFLEAKAIWTPKRDDEHDEMCAYFGCGHEKTTFFSAKSFFTYGGFLFILVASFFLPIQTLDHSIAMNRTVIPVLDQVATSNHGQKEKIVILTNDNFSEMTNQIYQEPKKYAGKTIKLSGMLHKADGLEENQFMISRFVVTHCIADARIIQFISEFQDLPHISGEDAWVTIQGELTYVLTPKGKMPYVLVHEWEKTEMPENPYVH
ncbi:TIGR03943 family putative permease subunit [Bacillus alkalicellulosilyticus]|uniref:TIGR03943 family putative permease subunit n=1 Tax=Alkalihalobacterium alkalicellulosilyticum TaxID=1912214 RepID=UPI0009986A15|nr:TIGR03943 family protein [Bacillus alkalicellulosilyticus]